MSIRILGLIFALVMPSGYAQSLTMSRSISAFTAVDIQGQFNVNLHTGYSKPSVTLMGDPQALAKVNVTIVQGVLHLSLKKLTQYDGPISVDIRCHYLNGLVYHGSGRISGKALRANLEQVVIDNQGPTVLRGTLMLGSVAVMGDGYTQMEGVIGQHLRVNVSEHAKLKLTGMASLSKLMVKDKGWFSMTWVKSPSLVASVSDKAYVELAGIVNQWDADVRGSATLNARYLRARRAFVKTHDNSVAELSALKHQHTLAMDASDIRFYSLPEMKTDFMMSEGAVLDMRKMNTAFVKQPTPYND